MPPLPTAEYVDVSARRLHVRQLPGRRSRAPLIFLHEGLGSVDLWRRFPDEIADRSGRPGLVYSRYGNGWSTPLGEPRHPGYMHDEALETLPEIVRMFDIEAPILVGHSDGASIALIYAGSGHPVRGLVLIAPHVFVEPETVEAISAIRDAFPGSDLPERMAKYHADAEATFSGWADIWLDPAFRDWNIEEYLDGVTSPALLVQGEEDQYGTTRQLDAIAAGVRGPTQRLMVPEAEHSPHLSHTSPVTSAVVEFLAAVAE